jgi:murein DD-endopeptidase MepM/ murein hydrolase activator NlpD
MAPAPMVTSRLAEAFDGKAHGSRCVVVALLCAIVVAVPPWHRSAGARAAEPTQRLLPLYPADKNCSPLTSLFGSMLDLDGSDRDEPHSGVDAGAIGDAILAPATGVVIAVWRANWGWGREGALMIRHSKADLGLQDGPEIYYSEFDHLRYAEIRTIAVGSRVQRGQRIATVFRPGGKTRFLPEVHWEVWSIADERATRWLRNEFGRKYWINKTGDLVDPLYLLSLSAPPRADGRVDIPAFEAGRDYNGFRGFTYILPCSARPDGGPQH